MVKYQLYMDKRKLVKANFKQQELMNSFKEKFIEANSNLKIKKNIGIIK